jgi:2-methylisocitrate lyase-like PEP mutase family enzyme
MSSLSEKVRSQTPLLVPGVSSPFEALFAAEVGFDALYVSGYAAAAQLGVPDIGLAGFEETLRNVAAIASVVSLPLIVDADTGYGDVANVKHTVERLEAAGASAIQLEDQVWPKKCGHMEHKRVIPIADARLKIEAALRARRSDDTLIIARTDAIGPNGFEDAIERANSYREAGADVIFIDAPQNMQQLEQIPARVPGACVANMSESGLTPMQSFDEFVSLGYSIVLFPTTAVRAAGFAIREAYRELRKTGTSAGFVDRVLTLDECNTTLQLDKYRAFEASLAGAL